MSTRRAFFLPRGNESTLRPDEAMEEYRQISENLRKAFNDEPGTSRGNGVNWLFVKLCLRTLKRHFYELKLLWKTVYLLFEHFEERRDPRLSPVVADVLYFIAYESYYAYFMLPLKDLPRVPSVLSDLFNQKLHNVVLNLMRQPYRICRTVIIPEADITWSAVMMDSEKFLPLLLRQGVAYLPPSSHVKGWEYCIGVLINICHLQGVWQNFEPRDLSTKLAARNPTVRQRIFTVFRAMDVVQHTLQSLSQIRVSLEGNVAVNYRERYHMAFETIPEPIVTLQEVRRILEKIFSPSHASAVNSFCSKFQEMMPESLDPITPRSLKHLCRCQVRDTMRVNGVFPYATYSLPIPTQLMKYLLLEDWFENDAVKKANERLAFFDWLRHRQCQAMHPIESHMFLEFPMAPNSEFEIISEEDSDEHPDPADEQPAPADEHPTPADEHPTSADEYPTPADEHPIPADEHPTSADEYPTPADEHPAPADEYPTSADEYPAPADEHPTSADEYPTPTNEHPALSDELATPSNEHPSPANE